MEYERTKLVEEGNTIYEIDLNCMRRKQKRKQREEAARACQKKGGQGPQCRKGKQQ